MGVVILRPNSTIRADGNANAHTILSDQSDASFLAKSTNVDTGNSEPTVNGTSYATVAMANITGAIPAQSAIRRVRFAARINQTSGWISQASGQVSFRRSGNEAVTTLQYPLGDISTAGSVSGTGVAYSTWLYSPPGLTGSWTPAHIDGIKAHIGSVLANGGVADKVFDIWAEVEHNDKPTVPTSITPAAGVLISSATPTLSGVLYSVISSGQSQLMQWQLATDAGFTVNARTVNSSGPPKSSGSVTTDLTLASKLSPGTWFIRARAIDTSGYASDWSPATSFTVLHTPSATGLSPAGGVTLAYIEPRALSWSFTDGWELDTQTAYQVIVERNDNGVQVLNSGKVTSADEFFEANIPDSFKDVRLRWRVRVWDSDDSVSVYSAYAVFTMADPPAVSITSPVNAGTVDSGAPTITWSFSVGGTRTQAKAVVTVRQVQSGDTVFTRTLNSAATSVTPPTTVLVNGVQYSVTVTVTDSAGMTAEDVNLFTTSYTSPNPIPYEVEGDSVEAVGYIEVDWSAAASDPRLIAWRVYRQELPDSQWELVQEFSDESVRVYRDYFIQSGESYMYTVTQVADRSGSVLESPVGTRMGETEPEAESRIFLADLSNYWLILPDRPDLTMMIPTVVSNNETLNFETSSYNLIGRGRHRDEGDELGYSGTLTFQIRQPEVQSSVRTAFENLRRSNEVCYLRTPFGRLFQVALGDPEWSPIAGVGRAEMGDMTISYEEVS